MAEAVTFAVPHATLGEDVASAVVLRPDAVATPKDIRQFATARIADFKIPRQVLVVREIPKGPTGKVQRIGLAAKLGLANSTALPRAFVAPRTPLEKALAKRWAEILQVEQIGIHDDFFASGGDSPPAIHVLSHVLKLRRLSLKFRGFSRRRLLRRWRCISNGYFRPVKDLHLPQPLSARPDKTELYRLPLCKSDCGSCSRFCPTCRISTFFMRSA